MATEKAHKDDDDGEARPPGDAMGFKMAWGGNYEDRYLQQKESVMRGFKQQNVSDARFQVTPYFKWEVSGDSSFRWDISANGIWEVQGDSTFQAKEVREDIRTSI